MTSSDHDPAHSTADPDEAEGHADEWIDETMAEGDIANGEGDPEASASGDGDR